MTQGLGFIIKGRYYWRHRDPVLTELRWVLVALGVPCERINTGESGAEKAASLEGAPKSRFGNCAEVIVLLDVIASSRNARH